MHFDLTDLRLIAAVAEANSITRGAERCHLSVPAVSMRIKNLEESMSVKLMYRSTRGVTLTPAGQALVHHACRVLGQLEQLRSEMQEYGRGIKGHLRLFASATAMAEFLPEALRAFLCAHPDVNIDLRERLSAEIVRAVCEGQTDIGIVSGPVRTEGLEAIPYRDDRLVLVVAPDHAFAKLHQLPFADTLDHDHISMPEGSAIHVFLQQKARELGRTIRLRIQVGAFATCCRMIEAGIGVGVMPESAAARHSKHMRLRIVPLSDEWSLRRQYICARSLELLPGYAKELLELLVSGSIRH